MKAAMLRTSASLGPTKATLSTLNSFSCPLPRLSTHLPDKLAEPPTDKLLRKG